MDVYKRQYPCSAPLKNCQRHPKSSAGCRRFAKAKRLRSQLSRTRLKWVKL